MDKLNVGIDAKWFFGGPPSGHMVVKNLVDELIRSNQNRFNLFLLINRKYTKQAIAYFPLGTNFIFLPNIPNMVSNFFIVPMAALKHNLQIVLFQNFTCIWPGKLYKIAYIHDALFLDYPEYYSKIELFYFKRIKSLAIKADMIITVSESEKKRMLFNHLGTEENINIVYHGISDDFKPITNYNVSDVQTIINKYALPGRFLLFVGRVNIRKNLLNLVKSLTFLDDKDIKLLIVGEENSESFKLEKFIKSEALSDRIVFTGHIPETDMQVIYACATIFCFPSFAEGFGLPPLEAMKCGVPVIVSSTTAMPEICGNAAVYINPNSPGDIAGKINLLLNDTQFYNKRVKQGLERAKNFVWKKSAGQIFKLIEQAHVN